MPLKGVWVLIAMAAAAAAAGREGAVGRGASLRGGLAIYGAFSSYYVGPGLATLLSPPFLQVS